MAIIQKGEEQYAYTRLGNEKSPYTLVFIHGATMTGQGMEPFAQQFEEFNCIVVDLAGHGNSIGNTKHTVEEFADCVQYLIEKLYETGEVTDKVTVLGFSMGGCITTELAIRKLHIIKQIVVMCSGAGLKGHTPTVDKLNNMDVKDFKTEELYKSLFGRNTLQAEKDAEIEAMLATKAPDEVGHSDLIAACKYDKLEESKNINIPLLVVAGDDDQIIPIEIPTAMRNAVKQSSIVVIPYRGHSVIYEEIDLVVKAIKDFLKFSNK